MSAATAAATTTYLSNLDEHTKRIMENIFSDIVLVKKKEGQHAVFKPFAVVVVQKRGSIEHRTTPVSWVELDRWLLESRGFSEEEKAEFKTWGCPLFKEFRYVHRMFGVMDARRLKETRPKDAAAAHPIQDRQRGQIHQVLYHQRSRFQDILIFESTHQGRVLVLDGVISHPVQ
ncbi:hypothetical protein ACHAXS_002267 [Conticribra weissflogii]